MNATERRKLKHLVEAVGGSEKLAEELGVTARAVRYWTEGEREPGEPVKRLIAMVAKRRKVPSPYLPEHDS